MQGALISLHEEILRPEVQRAIRIIYASTASDLARPKNEEILEQIELVLNRYDLIGSRIQCGVIPEKSALQSEWPIVLRLNSQLAEFIETEMALRGGVPYKSGFKWLVAQSTKYRDKYYPNANPQVFSRTYARRRTHRAGRAPDASTTGPRAAS